MVIVHYKNIVTRKKDLLEQIKLQSRQKKIYTGRIRLWIERDDKADPIINIKKIKMILSGVLYKHESQVCEVMLRRIPEKKGMSILIQDLDEYNFTHMDYDKLDQYIIIPSIEVVQMVHRMNEKERNDFRKRKKKIIPLTATAARILLDDKRGYYSHLVFED